MTKSIYINNRKKLTSFAKESDYILIGGNALVSKSSDVNYSFRQDSNMLYLTGVKEPSYSLLIDIKTNQAYLVAPKQTKIQATFEGQPNYDDLLKKSGCQGIISYQQLATKIGGKKVYFNIPPKVQNWGVFANPLRKWLQDYLKRHTVSFIDIKQTLATLRMIKQDYEVKNIQKAVQITKDTFKQLEPIAWQNGQTEEMYAYKFTEQFAKYGTKHAYEPIVASGANAASLHHLPSSQINNNDDQTLLLDIGAEYNNYCADISRTYAKKPDSIYEDIKTVQKELISNIKPGILLKDIHRQSVKLLHQVANKNKLDEPISSLFPHAIGHHLGLDVHDVADYKAPLQENMVITIEPGLYSKALGFGYRVEDDILVTKNGAKVL